ncbi:hypothetical protein QUC32_03420 [Novosphingobium resinovorum]|uniref:hypothetical protein n=1 Tax=Novosphingobium resinovorum TaxID=158500 RepID=UPI0025A19D89|nr:hypothetical protein [Novosphingobium resinovorum]MBF7013868.1 hypothetical protein [Novosphingobium sp. HR1a]WJM26017.1 hypothetical protein QUC32_03420 [Novosphingobium resinovorum]
MPPQLRQFDPCWGCGTDVSSQRCREMKDKKLPHEPIAGQRILVAGGTTGIGRATFLCLSKSRARLLTFGRDSGRLDQLLAHAELPAKRGLAADATRASRCDIPFLRIEPLRQRTK